MFGADGNPVHGQRVVRVTSRGSQESGRKLIKENGVGTVRRRVQEASSSSSSAAPPQEEDSDPDFWRVNSGLGGRRHATFAQCFGQRMPYGTESISYDITESQQFLEYIKRSFTHKGLSAGLRWAFLCGIGLGTGLVAISVDFFIEKLCDLRMRWNDEVVERVPRTPGGVLLQYLSFVAFRVIMAAMAGFLVCYVEVLAAGSGIPEIKCYLNGVRLKHVVGFRALVAKALGIVFSVAADLPVGKEGPMIHSGAIIGALLTKLNLRRNLRPFNLDAEKRDMVAAGASAGVSAAFGAPMGSVLFAIEEGTSHMNPSIMMRLFVSCSAAALVSRIFSSVESGYKFGELGTKVPVSFGKFYNMDYDLRELLIFTILALFGGAAGSLFNAMNKVLSKWRQRRIPSRGWKRLLEVILVDVLVVTILFWIPVVALGGEPVPFEGEFMTPTLKLFWSPGTTSMKALFHQEEPFHEGHLLLFALVNFELSCLTYGLGVPSGLFVPSLLTGAAFGRLFGQWVHYYVDRNSWANAGVYSLIGAVANLAGTARITISLAMILMEATGNSTFSLPIFYVVMVARWTGNFLKCVTDKGIYDMHIVELKHVPLLEQKPHNAEHTVQVREVMVSKPVVFELVVTVEQILQTLESCGHNGFPVVYPGRLELVGMIRRSVLHRILEHSVEHKILQEPNAGLRRLPPIPYEDCMFAPNRFSSYSEIHAELDQLYSKHKLDLSPYVDRNGYMMPKHASVACCFTLFRKLGLRHLPIVGRHGAVCGIVTRKDLILVEDDGKHASDFNAESEEEVDEEDDDEDALSTCDSVASEIMAYREDTETMLPEPSPKTKKWNLVSDSGFFGGM